MKSPEPIPTYSEGGHLKDVDRDLLLLVFAVGGRRLAVHLARTRHVLLAVEITALPGAPEHVRGVVDVHGEIMAVIDMHGLLGESSKTLSLSDHFVIVETGTRTVALLVDEIVGVRVGADSRVESVGGIGSDGDRFEAIARLDDSLTLIHDVEKFLSGAEALQLDRALADADAAARSVHSDAPA